MAFKPVPTARGDSIRWNELFRFAVLLKVEDSIRQNSVLVELFTKILWNRSKVLANYNAMSTPAFEGWYSGQVIESIGNVSSLIRLVTGGHPVKML
jgi:hypothetical protein